MIEATQEGEFPLKLPGETLIPGWHVIASVVSHEEMRDTFAREAPLTAHFDWDKVGKILIVRSRRRGDRFQPLGMDGLKKMAEFMIDAKVPRNLRQNTPVVSSPQQIIWLVGLRIDERTKVTESTKRVLRLRFERS